MTAHWLRVLATTSLVSAALCTACSASPAISVGSEHDGGGSGGVGGAAGSAGYGGGSNALTAHIEQPPGTMAIEVVTISCADECADVIAVASGGNPGYRFVWNDGVTTAAREVCVDDDTVFTVTVTDTAIDDGEFSYQAQTATAEVTARVIDCPSDGGVDGGACTNPDFDATPASGHYVGPGTYVCTDGNMPVPMLTLTLDLDVDHARATQSGTLYFQWGLAVIVAESDLAGSIECASGALHMTVENGTWGIPGPEPMSVVTTGTFTGEVIATTSGSDAITGTFHWVSLNLDGTLSNDCLVTYTATLTP